MQAPLPGSSQPSLRGPQECSGKTLHCLERRDNENRQMPVSLPALRARPRSAAVSRTRAGNPGGSAGSWRPSVQPWQGLASRRKYQAMLTFVHHLPPAPVPGSCPQLLSPAPVPRLLPPSSCPPAPVPRLLPPAPVPRLLSPGSCPRLLPPGSCLWLLPPGSCPPAPAPWPPQSGQGSAYPAKGQEGQLDAPRQVLPEWEETGHTCCSQAKAPRAAAAVSSGPERLLGVPRPATWHRTTGRLFLSDVPAATWPSNLTATHTPRRTDNGAEDTRAPTRAPTRAWEQNTGSYPCGSRSTAYASPRWQKQHSVCHLKNG
ncbi:keratinocyte proline-rich protein-like [Marmota monax]|uniref:keratinocyte proline-rich protein-like n=1 Tax=Marmota monax TaxID=9995 RepID=UPI0026EA3668|nr:keratinocyte proline-rich protein-like [Marmota monax]XP_058435379.1 keratinocyte proline-rich protein-like [Marmota monax]XP_058435380.1 keratinocyte proline-rich protein-like [Marmota monax]XP_058435381.1 keratinocyte proline-rich protein-like [Marmota monax]XP_058435382.1 keratinocyte proline-rich protein-like [Marmota monax]XP_058435383.1 keratinocyte proline-rich protein-like [Marmota monax]XP_058435384.1 keratinocyte proline-rich protein-like [Marmota monax]XP_058435385.1 keratinocy